MKKEGENLYKVRSEWHQALLECEPIPLEKMKEHEPLISACQVHARWSEKKLRKTNRTWSPKW